MAESAASAHVSVGSTNIPPSVFDGSVVTNEDGTVLFAVNGTDPDSEFWTAVVRFNVCIVG